MSPLRTVNVLLVEDDDLDAEAFERALRSARIANPIHRAADGDEALKMLTGEDGHARVPDPAIVVLDLNMPRMSGLEMLDRLRASDDPRLRRMVVFVLTTSTDEVDRGAAYDKHVAGYIVKTSAADDFVQVTQLLQSYWRVVELP